MKQQAQIVYQYSFKSYMKLDRFTRDEGYIITLDMELSVHAVFAEYLSIQCLRR